ncbi:MAG: HD-GYP domain-containing protein [Sphingomonadales bacterium]
MDEVVSHIEHCLSAVEEMRSTALRYHDRGVADICRALCAGMGITGSLADELAFAAGLHDIGKIVIPDSIIHKPGPLDGGEWEVMRRHPEFGHAILRQSGNQSIRLAANVVMYHHECWDGSGYPKGLSGEAIPREARIVAVCDVYHALREARPYRPALPHDAVADMILRGDGTDRLHPGKFDPEVLSAFRAGEGAVREAFDASLA